MIRATEQDRRFRLGRQVAAGLAVGLAATVLVLVHLFVPTTIGTADTGDGLRLLCQLQAGDPAFSLGHSSADRFAAVTYVPIRKNPVACGKWRVTERYPSSALAVLGAAKVLTHLGRPFGLRSTLDLRFAGIIYSLLYGLAIGLLVTVLPGRLWVRVVAASAVGVLGADATFVPYFISPYSEPMEYVALLLSFVGLLALWRRQTASPVRLALVTLAFGLLVTAKSQDTPLAIVLAAVLLLVRCPVGRLRGRLTARLVPAVAAALLLAVGGTMVHLQPILFHEQLVYSDVFYTILKDSPDPKADLAEMGLPTELSRYAGLTYFQTRNQTAKDPAYRIFVERTSFGDIARFNIRHPDRLAPVVAAGMRFVVRARHPLPNTTRADSPRPEVVCRICLIAGIGPAIAPAGPVLWPCWEVLVLLTGFLLVRRRADRQWRALGLLLMVTAGFAVVHLVTAVLGDGYAELGKHVFPAVVDTWLVIPLVVMAAAEMVRGAVAGRPGRADPAGPVAHDEAADPADAAQGAGPAEA